MRTTRRNFIKGMGAVGAAAELAVSPVSLAKAVQQANTAKTTINGAKIEYVKSTCVHCVNFCGINVKKQNGVIRAIYPDEARAEYYNHGICPKGVAGVFNTYNPYRVKKPLKRTNPKKGINEDPGWVEISWDEALSTITDKLKKIREDNPAKLVWQHGHGKYLIQDKFPKAWAKTFGTPNVVHRTTTCEAARHVADEVTWGHHAFLPDLNHTKYLILFGVNPFEAEQWSRWLDHAIIDAKARGMKLVVVDPRMSSSAAKADQWVPIRPGKDVALVLGMVRLLIEKGLIDEEFLIRSTNAPELVGADGKILKDSKGLSLVWDKKSNSAKAYTADIEPALRGVRTINGQKVKTSFDLLVEDVAEMTPQKTEEITGVPAEVVIQLATEFGENAMIGATVMQEGKRYRYRPAAAHTFRGMAAKEFGVQNWRSGLILQQLTGSLDAVGGLLLGHPSAHMEPTKAEYPSKRVDLQKSVFYPHATHNVCQQVALTQLDPKKYGLQYTPEMNIFYATNRPFSTSEALKQFEGYAKTYNVVIDIVMSDVTQVADIVLPDLTYLEAWQFSPTRSTPYSKHVAIRQPLTNVYNLPWDGSGLLFELAKRLGMQDEYIDNLNKGFKLKKYPLEKGKNYTEKDFVKHLWLEKTKGKSFDYAIEHAFIGKHLNAESRYHGVEKTFGGPDKPKMKLYADQLVESYERVAKVSNDNNLKLDLKKYKVALSPLPTMAHAFPTPHREAKGYPFYLQTYKRMFRNQAGNFGTNPILNNLGPDTDHNFVLINSKTAAEKGIKNGEDMVIETRVGKVQGMAKVTEGIRPDTVAVSYHYGQISTELPEYAKKGIWINPVLELHPDLVAGMNSFNDTKCKIYKAAKEA